MSLLPRSLLWRTVLLVGALLALVQLASVEMIREFERAPRLAQLADRAVSVVNLTRSALLAAHPDRRAALLAELSAREGIRIIPAEEHHVPRHLEQGPALRALGDALRRDLGEGTRVMSRPGEPGVLWVSFDLGDEDAYWLAIPRSRLERAFPWHWLGWGAALVGLALGGAWLVLGRVNRPLARLAQAAERLGRGEAAEALPEDGPEEIRALTRAFNRMVEGLARLDRDRALLLAGVSHDLRTPLARLRLAAEMLPDEATRAGLVQDVEDMDAIVGQFLAFVKEGGGEAPEPADLNALVAAAVERYGRGGADIAVHPGELPPLPLRRLAMQRLLANLIDNALKHGRGADGAAARVEVHTWRQGPLACLSVLDRGPGIPPGEAQRLLQPFARLDEARGGAAGSGLGLAIADRVARLHGGRLSLMNRAGGGLEVRLEIPAT